MWRFLIGFLPVASAGCSDHGSVSQCLAFRQQDQCVWDVASLSCVASIACEARSTPGPMGGAWFINWRFAERKRWKTWGNTNVCEMLRLDPLKSTKYDQLHSTTYHISYTIIKSQDRSRYKPMASTQISRPMWKRTDHWGDVGQHAEPMLLGQPLEAMSLERRMPFCVWEGWVSSSRMCLEKGLHTSGAAGYYTFKRYWQTFLFFSYKQIHKFLGSRLKFHWVHSPLEVAGYVFQTRSTRVLLNLLHSICWRHPRGHPRFQCAQKEPEAPPQKAWK